MKKKLLALILIIGLVLVAYPLIKEKGTIGQRGNIYSENYSDNYKVLFESQFANKFFNEVKEELEIDFDSDQVVVSTNSFFPIPYYDILNKNSKVNAIRKSSLYLEESYVVYTGIGYSRNYKSVDYDKYIVPLVYALAPEISDSDIEKIKDDISSFLLSEEEDGTTIELSQGIRVMLGVLQEEENEFHISVYRYFDQSDYLEEDFMYSESPEKIEELYASIPYNDILRDENGRSGEKHSFTGNILEYYKDGENVARAIVDRDGDIEQIYHVQFTFEDIPSFNFVPNDKVAVFGEIFGLSPYTTDVGQEITIPSLKGHYINLIEDSD